MPHEVISKIDADILKLLNKMYSLEDKVEEDSNLLIKFNLAQTYFEIGILYESKGDNESAANYFNDSGVEFKELLEICRNDIDFIKQYVKLLEYLGQEVPQEYRNMLKLKKEKGWKRLKNTIIGEPLQTGKLERTIEDALHKGMEYELELEKAEKLKETYLAEKSLRLKSKIAKALYVGLAISTDDDYGKNAVEHDNKNEEEIKVELINAVDNIRLMVDHFWGKLVTVREGLFGGLDILKRDAKTNEEAERSELLKQMYKMLYGEESIKTKMSTSEIGTSMDRRRFYFMEGVTRVLIREGINAKLNAIYKRYGSDYNTWEAWSLLAKAIPAFQKVDEAGVNNLIKAYDEMDKKDKKILKHDIKEMIAEITGESAGNEFAEKVNQGILKVTEYILKAGNKLDKVSKKAEKYLS